MTIIASSITGIVTFFLGVRKTKKEIESMALDNLEKSIGVYGLIIEDLKQEITELLKKVDDLENKIDELKIENQQLKILLGCTDLECKHPNPPKETKD